ncbi:uncharacterized protein PADG_05843 [Paracoccidioides brasiliensis Pb18]|uniref:Uncharacterized protein n=1 Tax=Paracoccidioides brasiliensis (strain Pb18) TaxID=502780 RepID=C1GF07_PARBD|nr:uncharacterized protein PADG_05843 [Paracoccidioides brasiliensis Pb18]EEH49764.2 hypothetical protein PADG_05843 [Paracoccidioides brasiliensis Pb18]
MSKDDSPVRQLPTDVTGSIYFHGPFENFILAWIVAPTKRFTTFPANLLILRSAPGNLKGKQV